MLDANVKLVYSYDTTCSVWECVVMLYVVM
jgi:hypothetical protein